MDLTEFSECMEVELERPLPRKISPCPISEAIIEIRYETDSPGEAVFGMVYSAFRQDFPESKKQPVLSIPEQIRKIDPNLMYLPEHHLVNGNFMLLVGPRSFALAVTGEYCGWTELSRKADEVFDRLHRLEFIRGVTRVGLRYINVFSFDILTRSTLRLIRGDTPLASRSSQIVAQIPSGNFENTLRVANGAVVKMGASIVGDSIVDIDVSLTKDLGGFFGHRKSILDAAHEEEKKLFFSLLTEEYLATLNPEY